MTNPLMHAIEVLETWNSLVHVLVFVNHHEHRVSSIKMAQDGLCR